MTFGQPLGVGELERRGEGEEAPGDRIVEALRNRIGEMGEGRA